MENGMTNDEFNVSYNFVKELEKINKMEKRDIPFEIQVFAMRNIVSRPEEHASGKACDAWIRKKRKKFANEVMDLFESINKPTDIKI